MAIAKYRNQGDSLTYPYEAGVVSGTVKVKAGLVAIAEGLSAAEESDVINWRVKGQVEFTAPSALVLADGASVRVDVATGAAVASGGVIAGVCVGGKVSGATIVRVLLNEVAAAS